MLGAISFLARAPRRRHERHEEVPEVSPEVIECAVRMVFDAKDMAQPGGLRRPLRGLEERKTEPMNRQTSRSDSS